jgi:hypothetical protein
VRGKRPYLREIRDGQRTTIEDMRDMRRRMSNLEASFAGLRTDVAHLHTVAAQQSSRSDDIVDRLERIEKRLNLVEA